MIIYLFTSRTDEDTSVPFFYDISKHIWYSIIHDNCISYGDKNTFDVIDIYNNTELWIEFKNIVFNERVVTSEKYVSHILYNLMYKETDIIIVSKLLQEL